MGPWQSLEAHLGGQEALDLVSAPIGCAHLCIPSGSAAGGQLQRESCFLVPLPKSTPVSLAPQTAVPGHPPTRTHTHSTHLLCPLESPAKMLTDRARGMQSSRYSAPQGTLISLPTEPTLPSPPAGCTAVWLTDGVLSPSEVLQRLVGGMSQWGKVGITAKNGLARS